MLTVDGDMDGKSARESRDITGAFANSQRGWVQTRGEFKVLFRKVEEVQTHEERVESMRERDRER